MSKLQQSGLQREVLALFRKVLRAAMKKDRNTLGGVVVQQQQQPQQTPITTTDNNTTINPLPVSNYTSLSFIALRYPSKFLKQAGTTTTSSSSSATTTNATTTNTTTTTTTTTSYAVDEFRKQARSLRRSDFKTIEYRIRKGEKQIKLLQMPGVTFVSGC